MRANSHESEISIAVLTSARKIDPVYMYGIDVVTEG